VLYSFEASQSANDRVPFRNACFLGPVIGPIAGGFAGKSELGWRSVFYMMFIFAMVMYLIGIVLLPETYAPVLVRRKAALLDKTTDNQHRSKYDTERKTPKQVLQISLTRPFVFLFLEPIVVISSLQHILWSSNRPPSL
jgi:MFS family permease